ncbi:hypothetical protein [Streptomyces murinus]|uniref:hypothetical protein n=1 Tax=Streptomyces murinus TaxID=33900 RepID=UPI0018F50236|nr:hypothetical protein [Streptomyces murinus]
MRTIQPLTASDAHDLGEAVGRIAAFAAIALHRQYPNLGLERLVGDFTSESATTLISTRYLAGIERGLPSGEAAGEAGADMIRAWADARLRARAQCYEEREAAKRARAEDAK